MPRLHAKPHKYQRIRPEIEAVVDTMSPGEKLPSEREMARHFSCTTVTVRRALSLLEEDGRIDRRHGSGTYVADKPVSARPLPATGNRLGILAFAGSDAYGLKVLKALSEEALCRSVDLRMRWVAGFDEKALRQVETLAAEGCCAVTVPWFPETVAADVSRFISKSQIPVSIAVALPGLERACFEEPTIYGSSVVTMVEGVCRYLHSASHDTLAFLGPDVPSDVILQRKLSGYTSYVCRQNMDQLCGLVQPTSSAMDTLAERWQPYCGSLGIVCYDDSHALRFMTAMHKRGFSAPNDYAIVGFNNIEESAYSDPPLTTVYHSYRYIAEWLIRNALAQAKGKTDQSFKSTGHTLLIRESCGGTVDDIVRDELADMGIDIKYEIASQTEEEMTHM